MKADAIPGRYSSIWFTPTKTGEYHLFCAEYCGTHHSGMIGKVFVMEPADYQAWLTGGVSGGSLAAARRAALQQLACNTCHLSDGTRPRAVARRTCSASPVKLDSGATVAVDEATSVNRF